MYKAIKKNKFIWIYMEALAIHPRLFLAQPLWACVVVSWCVVDNFYLWYCVESVIGFHEGTDALDEFTDLDGDITHECAACPSSHDHSFSR